MIPPRLGHPWVDESKAPLYILAFPPRATNEEVENYCREVEAWWPQVSQPVGVVIDVTAVAAAPPRQRQLLARHQKRDSPFTKKWYAGAALVVPNPWARGVITAVNWITPPNYPHIIVATRPEAVEWVTAKLAEAYSAFNAPR